MMALRRRRLGGELALGRRTARLAFNPPIDLNFASGVYFGVSGSPSQFLTTSNSGGLAVDNGGNWSSFAANQPRITNLGLLVEESRQNLVFPSYPLTGGLWNPIQIASSVAAPSPDGGNNALIVTPNTTANVRHVILGNGVTATAAVYTASVFLKPNGYNFGYLGLASPTTTTITSIIVDLTSGTITATNNAGTPTGLAASATRYPNGWVRLQVSMTCVATVGATVMACGPCNTGIPGTLNPNCLEPQFTADGTSGVAIWQAQLELGAFATSPIPTTSAAVTRAADVVSKPLAFGSVWSLFAAAAPASPLSNAASQLLVEADNGTTGQRAQLYLASGTPHFAMNGGTTVDGAVAGSFAQNVVGKLAASYGPGAQAGSFNGGAVNNQTGAALPTGLARLTFGGVPSGTFLNGTITRVGVWPTKALTPTQLQAITT